MSEYIREYSPENVVITWGGKLVVKGVADGTFLTATRNSPRTETVVGGKGDVGITRKADRTGIIEITLLQNSPTNQHFSYLVNGEDLRGVLTRANIQVSDPSGSMLVIGKRCHLQTPAPITLGDGQNANVWSFFVEDLVYLQLPEGLASEEAVQGASAVYGALQTVSDNLKIITN